MNNPVLKFKKLSSAAFIPKFSHPTDSGMDICSIETKNIFPGSSEVFGTGIAADIPHGYELQVRPRSGLAAKHGVFSCFGTVDECYTGEIKVTLFNVSDFIYRVSSGDRIAQLVLAPVSRLEIEEVDEISKVTDRGTNGFGSTGI